MQARKPSIDDIRESYLDPLVNLGLIEKTPSVRDGRQNIYFPVEYSSNNGSGNSDDNNANTNSNKVIVIDPSLYPTKNLIEESFRTLVKYPPETQYFLIKLQITELRT
jgi:hypothetical protein